MRIVIDIGHPAHVHYFRNFIKIMESQGHEFLVFARNREVVYELLDYYSIKFIRRGKGDDSRIGKLFYMFFTSSFMFFRSLFFKPDIFIIEISSFIKMNKNFFSLNVVFLQRLNYRLEKIFLRKNK